MNKIVFPREDVYGNPGADKESMGLWYTSISTRIYDRINDIVVTPGSRQEELKKRILRSLPQILLMPPVRMEKYALAIKKLYRDLLVDDSGKQPVCKEFGRKILEAFDYEHFRKNKLVELSARLNVKTCPYCNMNYTLYSENAISGKEKVPLRSKFTRFQFDHFFSKVEYPMLSMCLYNLIPCCSICNQGKSKRKLSLLFHPYHSDIQSLFTFEVERPLPGLYGARFVDYTPVKLKWNPLVSQEDADAFENTFHLSVLYSRHGDIVQEVYDKAYIKPYYINTLNFRFLNLGYLKRLWFDDYMTPEEIDKRPLSKFKQDVLSQAEREKHKMP